MNTYECLYCGVTFRRMHEMRACDICGHSIGSGWFCDVRRAEMVQRDPMAQVPKPTQKQAA